MIIKRTEKSVIEVYDEDEFWTIVPTYFKEVKDSYMVIWENRESGLCQPIIMSKRKLRQMFEYDVIKLLEEPTQ